MAAPVPATCWPPIAAATDGSQRAELARLRLPLQVACQQVQHVGGAAHAPQHRRCRRRRHLARSRSARCRRRSWRTRSSQLTPRSAHRRRTSRSCMRAAGPRHCRSRRRRTGRLCLATCGRSLPVGYAAGTTKVAGRFSGSLHTLTLVARSATCWDSSLNPVFGHPRRRDLNPFVSPSSANAKPMRIFFTLIGKAGLPRHSPAGSRWTTCLSVRERIAPSQPRRCPQSPVLRIMAM